jgi:hypothetical protein
MIVQCNDIILSGRIIKNNLDGSLKNYNKYVKYENYIWHTNIEVVNSTKTLFDNIKFQIYGS